MEQLTLPEYQERKQRIKDRLNQTVENFIVNGYELRQIRDTESFRLDGYNSLVEFAQAEFNLKSSTVSRFISININLTVNGEGVELLPELKGLGYSKLQDVLNLPEDDYQLLTPQTTVKEIRDLKKFNHADATAERLATPPAETITTPLRRCIKDFFSDPGHRSLLNSIITTANSPDYTEAHARVIAEDMNPTGTRTHQKGLIYLFLYDYNRGVSYKQMGKPQPVSMSWDDFIEEIKATFVGLTDESGETWCNAFGPAPEETEIPGQMNITQMQNATSQEAEKEQEKEQEKKPEKKSDNPSKKKREKPDPKAGMDDQELKLVKAAVVYMVDRTPALKDLGNLFARTIANAILQTEPTGSFLVDGMVYQMEISTTAVVVTRADVKYSWGIEYFSTEVGAHILELMEKEDRKEIPAEDIRELPEENEEATEAEVIAEEADIKEPAMEEAPPEETTMAADAKQEDTATAAGIKNLEHLGNNTTELWKQAELSKDKLNLLFGDWTLYTASDTTLQLIRQNAITIADNIERIMMLRES